MSSLSTPEKSSPLRLEWRDIRLSYTKVIDKKKIDEEILHGNSACLQSGNLMSIMGPSGAGKSSLLDILACRKTIGNIKGNVTIDGNIVDPLYFKREISAYVTQEDILDPSSTVKECVMFQAQLRLQRNMSFQAKEKLVLSLIDDVGLGGKENQRVGGVLPGGVAVRGLSGGERRRLSLCCGVVTLPRVLFCDEPTSGLDGFSALVVMNLLRRFADEGMAVVCTIHQPRLAIWKLFNTTMLIAKGYQVFFGSPDEAEIWFTRHLGFTLPPLTSPMDFMMDCINIDFVEQIAAAVASTPVTIVEVGCNKDPEAQRQTPGAKASAFSFTSASLLSEATNKMKTKEELKSASAAYMNSEIFARFCPPLSTGLGVEERKEDPHANIKMKPSMNSVAENISVWFHKFFIILSRDTNRYIRNPANALARAGLVVGVAIMMGLALFNMGGKHEALTQAGKPVVIEVLGMAAIFFLSIDVLFLLPIVSLSVFMGDRSFYRKESAAGYYEASQYYMASVVIETALLTSACVIFGILAFYLTGLGNFQPREHDDRLAWALAAWVMSGNTGALIFRTFCLLSSSQDVAFALCVGYSCLSILFTGLLIQMPDVPSFARWIQWLTAMRYPYNVMQVAFFRNTSVWEVAEKFTNPSLSMEENLLCMGLLYAFFFVVGYLALQHLNKEKR